MKMNSKVLDVKLNLTVAGNVMVICRAELQRRARSNPADFRITFPGKPIQLQADVCDTKAKKGVTSGDVRHDGATKHGSESRGLGRGR